MNTESNNKSTEAKHVLDAGGWIPVNVRLPYKDENSQIMCLVYDKYQSQVLVRPYNEFHKCWDDEDADDYYTDAIGGHITHWMPLPLSPACI